MADEDAYFGGTGGPNECAKFLQTIRAHAFSEDKARDDDWIADYAATRMNGSAVLWFESLEEETQTSWKLLRRALLEQYTAPPAGPRSNSPTPAAAPPGPSSMPVQSSGGASSTEPVAAAAPPAPRRTKPRVRSVARKTATGNGPRQPNSQPTPSLPTFTPPGRSTSRTGRLKLLGTNGPATLYVSRQIGFDPAQPSLLRTTASRHEALLVTYTPSPTSSSNGSQKQCLDVVGIKFRLGIVWNEKVVSFEDGSSSHAGLTAIKTGTRIRTEQGKLHPSAMWSGALHTAVWYVALDGEITAEWGTLDGKVHVLDTIFMPVSSSLSPEYEVYLYVDHQPTTSYPRPLPGRLMFESI